MRATRSPTACRIAGCLHSSSQPPMTKIHDPAYKNLYAHPELVADLIRGFVREAWVEAIDFSSLERVNASYVSPDWQERSGDLVWKVKFGPSALYVCLLFEFQSQPDTWMAARMLVYTGLLYQDLLKQPAALPGGRLPPGPPAAGPAAGALQRPAGVGCRHRAGRFASPDAGHAGPVAAADVLPADRRTAL